MLKLEGGVIKSIIGKEATTNTKIIIKPKNVFLAAGAINTPLLLRQNRISKTAGNNLQFHINLKVYAKFPDTVNAEKGTIFTRQIQEFEKEGLLIMGTNYSPPYLATALAHLNNTQFNNLFGMYENSAVYTPMIKPAGNAKIHSVPGGKVNTHKLDQIMDRG